MALSKEQLEKAFYTYSKQLNEAQKHISILQFSGYHSYRNTYHCKTCETTFEALGKRILKQGCVVCNSAHNNRKTRHENELDKAHPSVEVMVYRNHRLLNTYYCKTCETTFEDKTTNVLSRGCSSCNSLKAKRKLKHQEDIYSRNLNITVLNYEGSSVHNLYECQECDHQWEISANDLWSKGCPYCNPVKKRVTHEDFLRKLKKVHGKDISPIQKYERATSHIKCRCNKCSYEFSSSPHNLLAGYGCRNCAFDKSTAYKRKTVSISGRKLELQGFEDTALTELLLRNKSIDINRLAFTAKEGRPCVHYNFNGKKRRYFCDFYCLRSKTVYEVKSEYTLGLNHTKTRLFKMVQAKAKACLRSGLKFRLLLVHKGHLVKIPKAWLEMTRRELKFALNI